MSTQRNQNTQTVEPYDESDISGKFSVSTDDENIDPQEAIANKIINEKNERKEAIEPIYQKSKNHNVINFAFVDFILNQQIDTLDVVNNSPRSTLQNKAFIPHPDTILNKFSSDSHSLSVELREFYIKITDGIFRLNEKERNESFETLKNDPNVNNLLPYLTIFIKKTIENNIVLQEFTFVSNAVDMVKHLLHNNFVRLQDEIHNILPAVLSCCLAKKLCKKCFTNHWIVRNISANIVAQISNKYNSDVTNITKRVTQIYLKPLVDSKEFPLSTIYGAVKGIVELGSNFVIQFLLPNIKNISPVIFTAEKIIRYQYNKHDKKYVNDSKKVTNLVVHVAARVLYKVKYTENEAGNYIKKFGYLGRYLYSEVEKIQREDNMKIKKHGYKNKYRKLAESQSINDEIVATISTNKTVEPSEKTPIIKAKTSSTPIYSIASTLYSRSCSSYQLVPNTKSQKRKKSFSKRDQISQSNKSTSVAFIQPSPSTEHSNVASIGTQNLTSNTNQVKVSDSTTASLNGNELSSSLFYDNSDEFLEIYNTLILSDSFTYSSDTKRCRVDYPLNINETDPWISANNDSRQNSTTSTSQYSMPNFSTFENSIETNVFGFHVDLEMELLEKDLNEDPGELYKNPTRLY